MTTTITFVNGAVLPRAPHRWLVGDGPCPYCGVVVGEIHQGEGCPIEQCPQCFDMWSQCGCRTVDVIPNHGSSVRRWYPGRIEEHEDGDGRTYEMRVERDEE